MAIATLHAATGWCVPLATNCHKKRGFLLLLITKGYLADRFRCFEACLTHVSSWFQAITIHQKGVDKNQSL